MSKFINVTISVKPIGVQAFPSKEIHLSSDVILAVKERGGNTFEIHLKPEYAAAVLNAVGIDIRHEFSITTVSKEAKSLFEVVKA